jgi:hypothetical protein
MYIKANGSYIDGETITDPEDLGSVSNSVRPFFNQSNWLANGQFGWRDYDRGENFSVVVNYTGKRLSFLGVFEADDEYETPPVMVDLVYSKEFAIGESILEMKLEAENILNDDIQFMQEGLVTEGYELGRTFSLGFTYKF